MAGGPRERDSRGRLRDRVRSADRVAGQGRRSHGTGRPANLGPGPDQPIHDWQTVLTKQQVRLVHYKNNIIMFYVPTIIIVMHLIGEARIFLYLFKFGISCR